MKLIILSFIVALLIQITLGEDIDKLQFMKVVSPTNGQKIKAGDKVLIKYVMQPLVFKHTSNGYAKSLKIDFYQASNHTTKIHTVCSHCPVKARKHRYKSHKRHWTIPKSIKPGSYLFKFIEDTQFRRGRMTITETIKVDVVN
ncbi:uncharacterized protein BX663DRAFT_523552 [Cokeromyces recurvatus]|uniref:uncharacterized protein n=1 Tax=Cokeromyces recurvatus TaxID=90255 RepID=UPI00221FB084|nr:uncharacterized protein BX663DRAFT_523552 [Cokeromyces recurvatus]KAI7898809.1 hypothetical protein BX663DRAFT_523552 [Cokeromyces recurvatus]